MFDKKQYDGFKNLYTRMLHGEDTRNDIQGILAEEGMPPVKRVQQVAKMVSQEANKVAKRQNMQPDLETIIGSAIYLASDIGDIADKGGFFEPNQETLEATTKAVFQQGIKDDLVDPVELQEGLNEHMPEQLKEVGLSNASVPDEADETVAMEQYAIGREKKQAQKAQESTGRSAGQAVQEVRNGIS